MNERIKELRKTLGLSGEKFGGAIGLTRASISSIESGRFNLTEQSIKSICREFNVNEEWLRTGEGDMFTPVESLPLDELVGNMSELELRILKNYFSLDKEVRQKALDYIRHTFLDE